MQKVIDFFNKHKYLETFVKFFLFFLFLWVSYDILIYLSRINNDNLQTIRTMMIIPLIYCFSKACYLKGKNELTDEKLAYLIMIVGFTLRIGYAFYTGSDCRQHDVEMYNGNQLNINGQGHFSYTYIIYSTGRLPTEIKWQFYHPPLWHALCALFMHIYGFVERVNDVAILYDANIILSSFVSCLTLFYFKKIIFSLSDNKIFRVISFLLLACYPQFFIMAGWINNEGLAFMFMIISLYYGLVFHKNRSWVSIILCGITLGCGAMSKVSSALICAPLLFIFLYDFIIDLKNHKAKKTIIQGISFIGIVAPISLWFIIRNIVKFGITSIGVPGIDPSSSLGVINYSYWQRFGIPNLFNLNENIWCILRPNDNGYLDYNVWLYTLKCSIFGEYSYWQGEIFAYILLICNILFSLLTIFCICYVIIKEFKNFNNILMLIIFVITLISYIIFQILYPVTCTQDFRYMTLIILPVCYFVGKFFVYEFKSKWANCLKYISLSLVLCFCLSSILFYISCR